MTAFVLSLLRGSSGQEKPLELGDSLPGFSLKDQNGNMFNSQDFMGKKILVIFFYPKDESTICTKEACSFRDHYEDFKRAGAVVVGINAGSVESHKSFINNHQLPFTLLSDPDNKVLRLFGVKKKFFISGRETFVFDLGGKLVYTFKSMTNGTGHEKETLDFISRMQTGTSK